MIGSGTGRKAWPRTAVLRQKCVRRHVVTLQCVHHGSEFRTGSIHAGSIHALTFRVPFSTNQTAILSPPGHRDFTVPIASVYPVTAASAPRRCTVPDATSNRRSLLERSSASSGWPVAESSVGHRRRLDFDWPRQRGPREPPGGRQSQTNGASCARMTRHPEIAQVRHTPPKSRWGKFATSPGPQDNVRRRTDRALLRCPAPSSSGTACCSAPGARRGSDTREPLRRNSNLFNHLRRNTQLEALQQFAELVAVDQVDWRCAVAGGLLLGLRRKGPRGDK